MREIIVDLFAGGGGASQGIEQALGIPVDEAINHDPEAIAMHKANHPGTNHWPEDVRDKKMHPVRVTNGRPVGLLWASPDCTHFSRAKGGKPVKKEIRGLAWVVRKWARAVRPRVVILENVAEFKEWGPLDENDQPIKNKKGMTFNLWANCLRGLGYEVQFRVLRACDYGAPTIRKRLFMIARCDKQPIVWPQATHGRTGNSLGLPAYRTAAECIDWAIPCPSIFERKRPLVPNTMRRIARGIQRYVIDNPDPFIVKLRHTGCNGYQVSSIKEPLRTIVSKNEDCLVIPSLSKYHGLKGGEARGQVCDEPIKTIDTQNRFALVAAFLDKHYGGTKVGRPVTEPAGTVTARATQQSIVTAHLTKFYGTNIGSDMRKPVPTVTATGQHIGEVRAFLIKYYGTNVGQDLKRPMHTVTGKHRFGLVTIAGQQYRIADIGLRMLQPSELARAQGFRDGYILTGTKTSQVAKIGNSVCPPIAKAIVKANVRIAEVSSVKVG